MIRSLIHRYQAWRIGYELDKLRKLQTLRLYYAKKCADSHQRRAAQLKREARRTEAEPTLNDWKAVAADLESGVGPSQGPLRPQVHRPCTCMDCLKERFEASA